MERDQRDAVGGEADVSVQQRKMFPGKSCSRVIGESTLLQAERKVKSATATTTSKLVAYDKKLGAFERSRSTTTHPTPPLAQTRWRPRPTPGAMLPPPSQLFCQCVPVDAEPRSAVFSDDLSSGQSAERARPLGPLGNAPPRGGNARSEWGRRGALDRRADAGRHWQAADGDATARDATRLSVLAPSLNCRWTSMASP